MFTHYRTQGFVLKKVDRGDANQLFTIYTKDFGKLKILGKAIRKIKSKLKSGINLFSLSEIEFIQGKVYKTLTDAVLIKKHQNLKRDFKRLKITYKFSDIFDNLVKESEKDKKLWQLLNEFFEKLNNPQLSVASHKLLYCYFLWNFFSVLGYQPELYNCTLCQKKINPEKVFFSSKEGGLVCNQCKESFKAIGEIDPHTKQEYPRLKLGEIDEITPCYGVGVESDIIKIIRILIKKDWKTLKRLKIEEKELNSLKMVSDYYLSEILEKNS